MKWEKLILGAFQSIFRNKMRSLLTMLGIIIGVGSVIIMVALGQGTQAKIEKQIASLGTNLLMIFPESMRSRGVSMGAGSRKALTLKDLGKLETDARLVKYVSPEVRANEQIIAGNNNWSTSVSGVSVSYPEIKDWHVASGEFFTERDVKARKKVAVLGKTVADELFPGQDATGARLRIRNVPFTVIGVLSEKGQTGMGNDQDDIILAPYTTVLYRLGDGETIRAILASAASADRMDAAQEEIQTILRESHRLGPGEADDFRIRNQTDIIEVATQATTGLTMLLGAVAGVSLLVGGIGIMNIMLVSVTERTREIGIRLAVGARGSDVLFQFLAEAVILSLTGGIMGVLSGIGGAIVISKFIGTEFIFNPLMVAVAVVFTGMVGIFFGFYPARKAARMNPIECLRYE